jgi:hypothetical protein
MRRPVTTSPASPAAPAGYAEPQAAAGPALGARHRGRRPRGVALVTVILVMLIMMVVSAGFVAFTTQDLRASDSTVQATSCYNLAEAGLNYGVFLLQSNMLIYPTSTLNKGPSTSAFYPASPGGIINLKQTLPNGQEHVVVSDVSYFSSADNWMSRDRYCGSFRLTYSATGAVSGGAWTVTFNSVGFIKSIPSGRNTTDITQYYDIANTTNWSTVVAQRTLHMQVVCDNNSTNSSFKNQIRVGQFYEEFR